MEVKEPHSLKTPKSQKINSDFGEHKKYLLY